MEKLGEQFLHQKNPELHTIPAIQKRQERLKQDGLPISEKPADKIFEYLKRIEKIINPAPLERVEDNNKSFDRKERNIRILSQFLYNKVIVRPENIPIRCFKQGDRNEVTERIITDQKSSLDNWIDYFTSPESSAYPVWAKYWAFSGMLKLSTFDEKKYSFGVRAKNTIAPFPELNREALVYAMEAIISRVEKRNMVVGVDNLRFQKLLQGASFEKLYAWAIERVTPKKENEPLNMTGEWKKYDRSSDHLSLVRSLAGYGTGWCVRGERTAKDYLVWDDIFVYYLHNKQNKPIIPRLIIIVRDNKIREIRGVGYQQNIDPQILESNILDEKLKEFQGDDNDGVMEYRKRLTGLRLFEKIYIKIKDKQELTKDDLLFLYEINEKIGWFGYRQDPRMDEVGGVLRSRNQREDISFITGFSEEEISMTKEEALSGKIKFHYGDLDLIGVTSAKELKLPESISGNLKLFELTSIEGLGLPKSVSGIVYFGSLDPGEKIKLKKRYQNLKIL